MVLLVVSYFSPYLETQQSTSVLVQGVEDVVGVLRSIRWKKQKSKLIDVLFILLFTC